MPSAPAVLDHWDPRKEEPMAEKAKPGDRIVIEAHHVGEAHRTGEILEVLGAPGHEHYRVRWADGSETVFYPSSDAKIEPVAVKGA
jgi:hypothetical protein